MGVVKQGASSGAAGTGPRIRATEAVAIAEEVTSTLRHDLRNKFAAVRNAVFYIERSLTRSDSMKHDPRVGRFLSLVCEQLDAADGLLDQKSAHEGLVRPALEPIRVGACVERALSERPAPEHVEVTVSLEDRAELPLNADEVTLAIGSLIDNAFEAVSSGSPSGDVPGSSVAVRTEEDGEFVRVSVEDGGPGMTAEQRARAMVPFSSDKPGHAGLGLNIAARVAARLGGHLELVDRGATPGALWIWSVPLPR
jgi:signal transduction histidine kinase